MCVMRFPQQQQVSADFLHSGSGQGIFADEYIAGAEAYGTFQQQHGARRGKR